MLSGEILIWQKKGSSEISKEIELNSELKNQNKILKKCVKDEEILFYEEKIQKIKQELDTLRDSELDKFLLANPQKYMLFPKIFNYKKYMSLKKDSFIGEKEALSQHKFDKTYQVCSEKCVCIYIDSQVFVSLFDLQFKKINFIMKILLGYFPQAHEESLRWLAYQSNDYFFPKEHIIFKENQDIDEMFIIREGKVELFKQVNQHEGVGLHRRSIANNKDFQINKLIEGQCFGVENMFSSGQKRYYKAVSKISPFSIIYGITKEKILKIIYENSDTGLEKDFQILSKVKDDWLGDQTKQLITFNQQQIDQMNQRKQEIRNKISEETSNNSNQKLNSMQSLTKIPSSSIQNNEIKDNKIREQQNLQKQISKINSIRKSKQYLSLNTSQDLISPQKSRKQIQTQCSIPDFLQEDSFSIQNNNNNNNKNGNSQLRQIQSYNYLPSISPLKNQRNSSLQNQQKIIKEISENQLMHTNDIYQNQQQLPILSDRQNYNLDQFKIQGKKHINLNKDGENNIYLTKRHSSNTRMSQIGISPARCRNFNKLYETQQEQRNNSNTLTLLEDSKLISNIQQQKQGELPLQNSFIKNSLNNNNKEQQQQQKLNELQQQQFQQNQQNIAIQNSFNKSQLQFKGSSQSRNISPKKLLFKQDHQNSVIIRNSPPQKRYSQKISPEKNMYSTNIPVKIYNNNMEYKTKNEKIKTQEIQNIINIKQDILGEQPKIALIVQDQGNILEKVETLEIPKKIPKNNLKYEQNLGVQNGEHILKKYLVKKMKRELKQKFTPNKNQVIYKQIINISNNKDNQINQSSSNIIVNNQQNPQSEVLKTEQSVFSNISKIPRVMSQTPEKNRFNKLYSNIINSNNLTNIAANNNENSENTNINNGSNNKNTIINNNTIQEFNVENNQYLFEQQKQQQNNIGNNNNIIDTGLQKNEFPKLQVEKLFFSQSKRKFFKNKQESKNNNSNSKQISSLNQSTLTNNNINGFSNISTNSSTANLKLKGYLQAKKNSFLSSLSTQLKQIDLNNQQN